MDRKIIILLFLYIISIRAYCQTGCQIENIKPEVNKPCPDFELTHVTNYSKKRVRLSDFKGKWLFMDFWFTGCSTCINSFSKINLFQKEFKDKIQFLLVGLNDKKYNSNIESVFEKIAIKQGLELSVAYDSVLVKRWNIGNMPHIIIIDPQGTVKHITDGRDMTSEKIKNLLAGQAVELHPKNIERIDFNVTEEAPLKNNIYDKLIYRSLLTKWNGEKQNSGYDISEYVLNNPKNIEFLKKGWSVSMMPLYGLYNYAYLGRWIWTWRNPTYYGEIYHKPILEIQDSSLFAFDYQFDIGKGTYNYNLTVPPEKVTKGYLMREIQMNLKSAFGYETSVEMRLMPVWYLVIKPGFETRLMTKGGERDNGVVDLKTGNRKSIAAGFTIKNQPVPYFIHLLTHLVGEHDQTPFLDNTGIKGNIDITIDTDLHNFEHIRKALGENGLDFVRGYKRMKVLVIKDKKID